MGRLSSWIGEFVLIVVGVSIALAAENWVQDRRQVAETQALVAQLKIDTQENLRLIDAAIDFEKAGLASIEALMRSRMNGVELTEDSLQALHQEGRLFQTQPLYVVQGTLLMLAEHGGALHLDNHALRLAIMDYSNRLKINLDEYSQTKAVWGTHVDALGALYQATTGISDPMREYRVLVGPLSPEVIAHLEYVRNARVNMEWSLNQMRLATESLAGVLELPLQ